MHSAPSIVDVPEEKLVEFLHEPMSPWRQIAIPPLTEWPVTVRLRVRPAKLGLPPGAFGDIDALVVSKGDAAAARGVQYKRVKVSPSTFRTGQPNKLQELRKAAEQTNALVRLGLAHVWLVVIVVTDAREHSGGRYLVATPREVLDRVYEELPLKSLNENAGLVVAEIVQSVDRPFEDTGGGGGHMVRPARLQAQPGSLTASINDLFAQAA